MIRRQKKLIAIMIAAGVMVNNTVSIANAEKLFAENEESTIESIETYAIDRNAPIFKGIIVDKTEVTVGDMVTFSIYAEDEESNIESVELKLQTRIDGNYKSIYVDNFEYDSSSNAYIGTLLINENITAAEWKIDSISICDENYNRAYISSYDYDLPSINIVSNEEVDSLEILDITMDKTVVTEGEKIKFSVEVSNNLEEVRNLILGFYTNQFDNLEGGDEYYDPSHSSYISVEEFVYNSATKRFEAELLIDDKVKSGQWKLLSAGVQDLNGNNNFESRNNNLNDLIFTVDRGDNTVATVSKVVVEKDTLKFGESTKISVFAEDKESGIKSIHLQYPIGMWEGMVLKLTQDNYNEETGAYEIVYTHNDPELSHGMTLHLSNIYAVNKALLVSSNVVEQGSGNITLLPYEGEYDETAPALNDIALEKNIVQAGEKVKVSVDFTEEESFIYENSVYVSFANVYDKSGQNNIYVDLKKNDDNGKYEGFIETDKNTLLGKWQLEEVSAVSMGGYIYLDNSDSKLPNVSFELVEEGNDITSLGYNVVTSDMYLTNTVIEGDLYVAPNAILNLNGDVTINGNLYVLGSVKSYGNLTVNNKIFVKNYIEGNTDSMELTESVVYVRDGMINAGYGIVNDEVVSDVPVEIYSVKVNKNLRAVTTVVEGATVNIGDLFINGEKIELNNNGTFRAYNLPNVEDGVLNISFKIGEETIINEQISVEVEDIIEETPVVPEAPVVPELPEDSEEMEKPGNFDDSDKKEDEEEKVEVKPQGGTNNGTGNNSTESNNTSNNNSNISNKEELPKTGGTSALASVIMGLASVATGVRFRRKK